MKRWIVLLLYAAAIAAAWVYKDVLLDWMKHGHAPVYLAFIIVTALAFFPIVPFSVVIGLMGFLYGPVMGALLSWMAAWVAGMIMYGLFRYAFRAQGRALLARYSTLDRWTSLVEKHPFRFVLAARLMPVMPQYVVNCYAAVTGIRFPVYALASAIGKLPAMFVFAFIGRNIFSDTRSLILMLGVYALFLLIVYGAFRVWKRMN
ncbi:TVP38/TMEM64 family protein [Paenibacillus solisilvae]|uniref:TVP38/TMEM64 family membrane protein n=1 Tax=Paenibacillus solisilvae TaxID=2486751 RepID=A0ABW0W2S9_9BACL